MAAAIFRSYWVRGSVTTVAVIGDISLDTRWRGRGLGQVLLRFMTQHLDENTPRYGLVIPTESARRSLAKVGWTTAGELGSLVFVLDAEPYVRRFLPGGRSQRSLRAYCAVARISWRGANVRAGGSFRV